MRTSFFRTATLLTATTLLVVSLSVHPTAGLGQASQAPPTPSRGGKHGQPSPAMELDRLAGAMQAAAAPLTDDQKTTILGILQDRATAMKALRRSTASPEDQATQRRQLMESSNASIRALLSEAQTRVFDAMLSSPPPSGESPSGSTSSVRADSLIDANTGGDPGTAAY